MKSIDDRTVKVLLTCAGGSLCAPPFQMVDRRDGGNLWVLPPREVWDRSELDREELIQWSFLVAAAGRAMLDALPQLEGGVINYWEAGNWALNHAAEPKGQKVGYHHKKVHMHLVGRSPDSKDADWQWGEAPMYPYYKDAAAWMADKKGLTDQECRAVAEKTRWLLVNHYDVANDSIINATELISEAV